MTPTKPLDVLLFRQQIADVIYRYARGIDRLDFDLVRSCYHPDAYDDHGSFRCSVEELITAAQSFLPKWTITQHFMGNMLIEIEGQRARAETYAVAYHRREDAEGNGKDDVMGIFAMSSVLNVVTANGKLPIAWSRRIGGESTR